MQPSLVHKNLFWQAPKNSLNMKKQSSCSNFVFYLLSLLCSSLDFVIKNGCGVGLGLGGGVLFKRG